MDRDAIHQSSTAAEQAPQSGRHAQTVKRNGTPPSASPCPPSTYARYDQMAQNYSSSQAATSVTGASYHHHVRTRPSGVANMEDGRTDAVTATDQDSFYSYHSSQDLSSFVKEIDGRMFNAQSELYMMPSDNGEFQRLDKQHYALVLGLGGLYPCPNVVESILEPSNQGEPRSILDLGCGSGIWAIEMARKYPNAAVVALDLAPCSVDLEAVPSNCRFEIDDINLGLSHYHGQFDVIHARCIGSGILSYGEMMLDVEACLKPGGIAIFIDGDMTVYQEDMVSPIEIGHDEDDAPGPPRGSWMARLAREMRFAAVLNGSDIDGLENRIDEGMWDHHLIDPASVGVGSLFTPIGPWLQSPNSHEQQQLQYIGSLIRQDLTRLGDSWQPMLKKYGISQEKSTEWTNRTSIELEETRFRTFMRWRLTWGVRRTELEEDGTISTRQPKELKPPADLTSGRHIRKHTIFHVYNNKEDARRAMELRKEKTKHLPKPLVNILAEEARGSNQ